MAEVFRCKDKDGIEVICPQDVWTNHIVAQHPEMTDYKSHVKYTIESPHQVYQDKAHTNRKSLYRLSILPQPYHTGYLRIVVEYRQRRLGGLRGKVISAFPCDTIRKGDILLWQQQ